MNKHNTKFLVCCEKFLQEYEPLMTQEQLIAEFKWVLQVHRKFRVYLKNQNIHFKMPLKRKDNLERRRIFMHWYIDAHPNKLHAQAVKDLEKILMVTDATIYDVLAGRR